MPETTVPDLEQTQNILLDFFDRIAMGGLDSMSVVLAAGVAGQELRGESDDPYPNG